MEVHVVDRPVSEVLHDRPTAEPVSWSDHTRVVLEVDSEGTILRATPAARQLLAHDGDLVGQPFRDLLSETDRDHFTQRSVWLDPHSFTSLLLFSAVSPIPACFVSAARRSGGDAGGGADSTLLLWGRPPEARDLREARVLMAARYEIVGQIASGVAHELNNVLSTVTTLSDLLLARTEKNSAAWDDLVEIKEAALEAAEIARSLDLFGKGRRKVEERIQIDDTMIRTSKLMRRFLPAETILDVHVAEDCPPVRLDPLRLQAALMALVANARDAMPRGGELTVRATPLWPSGTAAGAIPWLRVEVMDTGTGLDVGHHDPRAPFSSTKPLDRGTGLGAAVAHRLAVSVGGRFTLVPRDGGGAVARLELPGSSGEADRGQEVT